jgi:hypothetical protein
MGTRCYPLTHSRACQDAKDGLSADEDILGVDADEDDAPLPTMMDDLPEMMLFQAPPTAVKKASEQKQDTSVVVHKLPMAKTFATETFDEGNKYDDEHYKPDNNEFQGDGILSAVGIKDAASSEVSLPSAVLGSWLLWQLTVWEGGCCLLALSDRACLVG